MVTRREFLRKTAVGTGLAALSQFPLDALAQSKENQKLTIAHTNDVHSRLDPFPMDGGKYEGMGGIIAREKVLRKLRAESEHTLLLDAGDMFQGTPYFNFFKGEPEIIAMNMLGYDAATIGNHDFDAGVEGLLKQLEHAQFELVNCNYDFGDTGLDRYVKPYTIIRKGRLKIGMLGVGIALQGLVPDSLCNGVTYFDPILAANEWAYRLKVSKRCDYVICLSHLGFEYKDNKVSDKVLASESEHIDMILGGHTHTFLDAPLTIKNLKNQTVVVNQVGWGGVHLGVIDIFFNHKNDIAYTSKINAVTS